ncbi:MAG: GNAT family N-acetyltransferase [bacterium]
MSAPTYLIYHIAERDAWESTEDTYRPVGFESEGFVHCSRWSQVRPVAKAMFAGRDDLVLLEIDPIFLQADVRYEDLYESGERYPHVYGPIPREAVIGELKVRWDESGEPVFARPGNPDSLALVPAGEDDLDLLARLNEELREDEGCRDSMDRAALRKRMAGFLASDYEAWFVAFANDAVERTGTAGDGAASARVANDGARVAAYALVRTSAKPLYLRQLSVRRGLRRTGVGRRAVDLLAAHYGASDLDVDVLAWNEAAKRFWHGAGFEDRSVSMRWTRGEDTRQAPAAPAGEPRLEVVVDAAERASAFLLERLRAYNDAVSPYHRAVREPGSTQALAVMLTGEDGRWVGGATGTVLWGWLDVDYVWVSEEYRGRGHGRRLLLELERQAAARGADRSRLSTFSFQARGLYEKLGYRVAGELADFPPGGALYWMRKDGL